MKKYLLSIIIGLLGIFSISCDEDNNEVNPDTASEEQIAADVAFVMAEIDEIYRTTDEAFSMESNGRVNQSFCASIELDIENKIMAIDYGDGCTGSVVGIERKGKITVVYTGTLFEPASGGMSISFDNYEVNGNAISGTTSVTAISGQTFQRINDLTVNFNGAQVTVDSDLTYTWTEGAGDRESFNEVYEITGTASGIDREGISYSVVITQPWEVRTTCFTNGQYYPVKGISTITLDQESSFELDFGNGECDKLATISIGNISKEIRLP